MTTARDKGYSVQHPVTLSLSPPIPLCALASPDVWLYLIAQCDGCLRDRLADDDIHHKGLLFPQCKLWAVLHQQINGEQEIWQTKQSVSAKETKNGVCENVLTHHRWNSIFCLLIAVSHHYTILDVLKVRRCFPKIKWHIVSIFGFAWMTLLIIKLCAAITK